MIQVLERKKFNYLLELKSAHQHQQVYGPSKLKRNTVVLIKDNTSQLIWRMSVVIKTHPGREGQISACTVRLPTGAVTRRLVQLLLPPELSILLSSDEPHTGEVVAKIRKPTDGAKRV